MTKLFVYAWLLFVTANSFCQQTISTQPGQHDFLQKSKNQKAAARVMLIGGGALVGIGFLIGNRRESTFDDAATGAVIGSIGVLSSLGSIPLFIASTRNKNRAAQVSSHIKLLRPFTTQPGTARPYTPALSLQLNF